MHNINNCQLHILSGRVLMVSVSEWYWYVSIVVFVGSPLVNKVIVVTPSSLVKVIIPQSHTLTLLTPVTCGDSDYFTVNTIKLQLSVQHYHDSSLLYCVRVLCECCTLITNRICSTYNDCIQITLSNHAC